MAHKQDDLVEVTVKLPARLRDHLASICSRDEVKLDDIVREQIERWLLGQTIALLEGEDRERPPDDGTKR